MYGLLCLLCKAGAWQKVVKTVSMDLEAEGAEGVKVPVEGPACVVKICHKFYVL